MPELDIRSIVQLINPEDAHIFAWKESLGSFGYVPLSLLMAANSGIDIVAVRDVKSAGSLSGSSIMGWQVRDITEVSIDSTGDASLANNLLTLPAGNWVVLALLPSFRGARATGRLYNMSLATETLRGGNGYSLSSAAANNDLVLLLGPFVLASQNTLAIEHYLSAPIPNRGLGMEAGEGIEVFTQAIFLRGLW